MTSGNFHRLPISSILVDRASRQRRELTHIPELADSIARLGQIHPIVIQRDGTLIAGERRLAAHQHLGLPDIMCQYADELEPSAYRAIELEENIKRQGLDWMDECRAIAEFHAINLASNPAWIQDDTAEALGISRANVTDRIAVAKSVESGNERAIAAPKYSTALGIVKRTAARAAESAVNAIQKQFGTSPTEPAHVPPKVILNESFIDFAPVYDGPRFNFIHCDFPYGIGADSFNQGSAAAHGGYADSSETYWELCRCLASNLDRLATGSAHLMFWFSMEYYHETLEFFARETDFVMSKFPLIWVKSDNVGILPDPTRGPRRIYETALIGSRGDRPIVGAVSNAYSAPSVRGRHMSEKNQAMLAHFFRMFVDHTSSVLDPTCGSGSALRAADALGAVSVRGLELNREFADIANTEFDRARAMRKAG